MALISNDKLYNTAKWTAAILLPALNVLWVALATTWHLSLVQEISTTLAALNVFLGAIVGISNIQYVNDKQGQ